MFVEHGEIKMNDGILTPELKSWIDSQSYETLLHTWRFAPVGSIYFQGNVGRYYAQMMEKRKHECDHVAVSKNIGWKDI